MADNKNYEDEINKIKAYKKNVENQNGWNAVARNDDSLTTASDEFEPKPAVVRETVGKQPVKQPIKQQSQYVLPKNIEFGGKSITGGSFSQENLEGANFSAANLSGANLSGANLRGVDFSGANLQYANLSGADLTGAILTGANLVETNFTGATLHNVKLLDADIQNAILIDIIIDDMTLEELQELVEYLAQHFPHKLNLSRINLTLLDLKRIDLTKVNLRGVDFTGVDFTGVSIIGLDLSECIITPQQIAQAMGRTPSPDELKKILAPKEKNKGKGFEGLDFDKLFLDDGRDFGTWDFTKDKGTSIEKMLTIGKKIFRSPNSKPPVKEDEILSKIRTQREAEEKNNNRELRDLIEQRKKDELEARKEKKREQEKNQTTRDFDKNSRDGIVGSRGGNER